MIAISDLFVSVTADQAKATFVANLVGLGVPADKWRKAGAYSTILTVVAITYSAFSRVIADFILAGFLEKAAGGWLTLLAFYGYGVARIDATFATGSVTLTNSAGGVFPYGVGEATFKNSTTGIEYINTEPIALAANGTQTFAVQATTLGSVGTSAAGQIDSLVTQMSGVSVTNALAVVGRDEETDPDLRDSCRAKTATFSANAPRGSYHYAVTHATRLDGSPVDINRVSISPFSSTGVVNIYCASPSGAPTAADLDAVRASIKAIVNNATDTVNVYGATPVACTRALTIWAKRTDGVDASAITTAALADLADAIAAYPISGIPKPPASQGYLYSTFLEGAGKDAHAAIYAVDGAGPDLALNAGQVATNAITIAAVRFTEVP